MFEYDRSTNYQQLRTQITGTASYHYRPFRYLNGIIAPLRAHVAATRFQSHPPVYISAKDTHSGSHLLCFLKKTLQPTIPEVQPSPGSQSSTMTGSIEGFAPFPVPGLAEPCQTWYKVIGDLNTSAAPPLIVLHGGPGACHDYLLPLSDLAPSTPLVFYDQIGNGRSTHLPEKNGDEKFWSVELFMEELDNLLLYLKLKDRPIDLYGHSWGGMLAAEWAAARPPNLRRLIISNSLASMDVWREGVSMLRAQLPADVQKVLDHAEETLDFESSEYQDAVEVFYKRHLSLSRPWPSAEVQAALDWFAKDPTTYGTMWV